MADYFLYDTFTDPDGTALEAHTPEVGGAWSALSGAAQITGNDLYRVTPPAIYRNAADIVYESGQYVMAMYGNGSAINEFLVEMTADGTDYLRIQCNAGQINIRNPAGSELASGSQGFVFNNPCTYLVRVTDLGGGVHRLQCYHDRQTLGTFVLIVTYNYTPSTARTKVGTFPNAAAAYQRTLYAYSGGSLVPPDPPSGSGVTVNLPHLSDPASAGTPRILSPVQALFSFQYAKRVDLSLDVRADLMAIEHFSTQINSPMRDVVQQAIELEYLLGEIANVPVLQTIATRADLLSITPVHNDFTLLSVLGVTYSDSIEAAYAIHLVYQGRIIDVINASIKKDESDVHWDADVELSSIDDYLAIENMDDIELVIGPQTFAMVVTSKVRSRSDGNLELGISLRSPTIRLDQPYNLVGVVAPLTWPAGTGALQMAQDLLNGYPLDWRILDWVIPVGRFVVSAESALSAVSTLAEAVGALLSADPDGTLVVRYRHEISPSAYTVGDVDSFLQIGTDQSVLTMRENSSEPKVYNKYRILDIAATNGQDRIEQGETPYDLHVYPQPWRQGVGLTHSAVVPITITPLGVQALQKVQDVVEFFNGEASLSYPINTIEEIVWLGEDLTGVFWNDYEEKLYSSHPTKKYSIAKITYTTRAHVFRSATAAPIVQYLVQNTET